MPLATLQPTQLLHYLPTFRVLICKECRYAIQPSAISRHLKDIHHIYREDRQAALRYTLTLALADPGDVIPPEPHESPVPFIPTERGLACSVGECNHLCVTIKRMKSHWATSHRDVIFDGDQWRPVDLQSFFRGNQLRYFIVSPPSPTAIQLEETPGPDVEKVNLEVDKLHASLSYGPEWDAEDIFLFEHFRNSTYLALVHNADTRNLWQTTIPQLASSHPFLKHGILACSALHLAHLIPSSKQDYNFTAARHQNEALPAFRSKIANPTEGSCDALIAFSQLLILHTFASEEQDEHLLLVGRTHESGSPDWMKVIRGSCVTFKDVRHHFESGPFKPLVISRETNAKSLREEPESQELLESIRRLGLLATIPFSTKSDPEQAKTQRAFGTALLELSRAFRMADASKLNFSIWTALYIWPAQVPQDYLDILAERHPGALILLAHYCILLGRLECHWYMSGFRKRLLSRIYRQLDPEWHDWLQWPLEGIGLPMSTV
jgi:hypothetical protein